MRSSGVAPSLLVIVLATGCGGQDATAARTPAEAVAQQAKDATGVRVAKLVRLDYGETIPAPPTDDDAFAAQLHELRGSVKVSWQLWMGPDRLPRRIRLVTPNPGAEEGVPRTAVTEIGFTGWGSDVSIEPPPKDQVHETGSCLAPEPR